MKMNPGDPRISAYLLGELSADARRAFEQEIEQSKDLREAVRETGETIDLLRNELTDSDRPGLRLSGESRAAVEEALEATVRQVVGGRASLKGESLDTAPRARRGWRLAVGTGTVALSLPVAAALLVLGLEYQMENLSSMVVENQQPVEQTRAKARLFRQSGRIDFDLDGDIGLGGEDAGVAGAGVPGAGADSSNPTDLWGYQQANLASESRQPAEGPAAPQKGMIGLPALTGPAEPLPASDFGSQAPDGYSSLSVTRRLAGRNAAPSQPPADVQFRFGAGGSAQTSTDEYVRQESLQQQEASDNFRPASVAGDGATPVPAQRGLDSVTVGELASESAAPASAGFLDVASGSEGRRMSQTGSAAELSLSKRPAVRHYYLRENLGQGMSRSGDKYDAIIENEFLRVTDAPLSTFSIDVDSASYAKVRMYLNEHRQLPRPDAVRIEELINYFPYDYSGPDSRGRGDGDPFAAHQDVVACPWNPEHKLVRIGLKGREVETDSRPRSNLVFLLDVSGSMDQPNKLPLLKRGMRMLTNELNENDRVAIVVYAGAAGMVLDSTTGDQKAAILGALARLNAGGSTNGGDGIQLAYQTALDNFVQGGVNRVILCTDGDFNVGVTGTDALVEIVDKNAKTGVFLSVLGFGIGNHNDAMLERISNKGNGNYAFVDTDSEARKVLVEQLSGTLVTIAKDVKIQVEFNPGRVSAYRLIGYENRVMAAQDFNNDRKDAGEIGAGHTVTALYEVVPVDGRSSLAPPVDDLKYQTQVQQTEAAEQNELLTLKVRYKQPDGTKSKLLTFPLVDSARRFHQADRDFQFAAAVASFGMLLRCSAHAGNASFGSVLEMAAPAAKDDESGYRQEFLELVRRAAQLQGESLPAQPSAE